jgi:hypothetical protein
MRFQLDSHVVTFFSPKFEFRIGNIGYAQPALFLLADSVAAPDFIDRAAVSCPFRRAFFLERFSIAFSSFSLCHF